MKRLFSLMMLLVLALPFASALAGIGPSPERVTEIILSFRETYPDGYLWSGEEAGGGSDFLQMVSDAAFGSLSPRLKAADYKALRPGDILRVKKNTYSVMVIEKYESCVTVVEVWTDYRGDRRVYWGRTLSKSAVEAADCIITRYPAYTLHIAE